MACWNRTLDTNWLVMCVRLVFLEGRIALSYFTLIRPSNSWHCHWSRPRSISYLVTFCCTPLILLLGLMFSHLMKFSHKRGFIDRESYVAQYLSLAIFITGVVRTIGSDDLLATFAAGQYHFHQTHVHSSNCSGPPLQAAPFHGTALSTSTLRTKYSPPSSNSS
jgi:hypothetical protein